MLKCKEVANLASDYLDKNLSWKDSFSLKMHIMMCKHCNRFIHHLRLTIDFAQGMKGDLTSPDDVKHVLDNLHDKNKS